MGKISNSIYKARAKIAKALAHWLRIEIVDLLAEEGEKCVCELTEALDASQSVISKHLSTLKEAGIIDSRKEGLNVYYFLETPCIVEFFSCLDDVIMKEFKRKRKKINNIFRPKKN
ncbi:ArsR/SmtB family transcription factor [Acetohalobium arabaticum]|uniref:Transcriptional regulator, ArsR family n=1 Tax=Acetohalobium arabaticum (strain ATCC 49924 / DSM 5501 / Z-7288) TaxID=574087 RepID=D9QT23_ACEAZ|nr:metalloregulator ArsR/SmtB family transcription factor [Acetohalobium arabaticum]ADL13523.1 transcriptional regulator, ArsR family [Acetohalobium arabaticum DSM 5501]